jgi:hypothetical protein
MKTAEIEIMVNGSNQLTYVLKMFESKSVIDCRTFSSYVNAENAYFEWTNSREIETLKGDI